MIIRLHFFILALLILLSVGCAATQMPAAETPQASTVEQQQTSTANEKPAQPLTLIITSPAFTNGATIPIKYSCDGQDINPPLSWSGAPEGTKSFALIIDDPDAVKVVGRIADHWVLWNIPASVRSIAENSVPIGASQGMSYGAKKYQGPCPPPGIAHRYLFKLYALDVAALDLPTSTTGAKLEKVMQRHVLQIAEMTGKYMVR